MFGYKHQVYICIYIYVIIIAYYIACSHGTTYFNNYKKSHMYIQEGFAQTTQRVMPEKGRERSACT